jgi:hypothetical protein
MDAFRRLPPAPTRGDALRGELSRLHLALMRRRRWRVWLGCAAALLSVLTWGELRLWHGHFAAWAWLGVTLLWLAAWVAERPVARRCDRLVWELAGAEADG